MSARPGTIDGHIRGAPRHHHAPDAAGAPA